MYVEKNQKKIKQIIALFLLLSFFVATSLRLYREGQMDNLYKNATRKSTKAKVVKCTKGWKSSRMNIAYEFSTDGKTYKGKRVWQKKYSDEFCSCLFINSPIVVYDSTNPQVSFLLISKSEYETWGSEPTKFLCY